MYTDTPWIKNKPKIFDNHVCFDRGKGGQVLEARYPNPRPPLFTFLNSLPKGGFMVNLKNKTAKKYFRNVSF